MIDVDSVVMMAAQVDIASDLTANPANYSGIVVQHDRLLRTQAVRVSASKLTSALASLAKVRPLP